MYEFFFSLWATVRGFPIPLQIALAFCSLVFAGRIVDDFRRWA